LSRVEPFLRVPAEFEDEFPDGSALATELFLNLGMLVGGVRSAVEDHLRARGVTSMAAFNVLTVVGGAGGPLQPSQIADRMMVTRATMTGLVDGLDARGLLTRRPAGSTPRDGRHRLVAITPAGRALVDALVPELHRIERALMACLSEREQRAMLSATAKLQRHLTEVLPEATLGLR
jgi:DNA-binding MarR family transcriptional regulator